MVDYGPVIKRLLTQSGWHLLRQGKGDHEIWVESATGRTVTVDAKVKSRHTSSAITKFAGLGKKF